MHRGWHNMNARYNGYFYSNDNMKETVKKIEKNNKDDFSKIIPIYVYPDNNSAKTYFGDLDKTIKKSSTVIQRHAIQNKKTKEEIANACKWIDENYVLIGRAHLYKRDLFSALETFEYVSKKYPNPEAKYMGMLWLAKTQNEIGSYSQTELILDNLRNAKDLPATRYYQKDFALVTADFYIKRNDYSPAIKSLTKAITLTKNKRERARYVYVLAQLYESMGENKKASQYYSMVPNMNPKYEMIFNAQMKRAQLFEGNAADSKIVKKQLMKMLKDAKNTEYQDQIYYALAQIEYQEKHTDQSLVYLEKSVRVSVSNNSQKALSYLKRADIFFDVANYTVAQANYDSTIMFLPQDYPNYKQIDAKKKSLTNLVVNLKVIALEDSLQALGKMNEADRNEKIDKIIDKIEEEERLAAEQKLIDQNNLLNQNNNPTTTTNTTASNSSWYFYNPGTVAFGVGEFNKKWGPRKLEDDWRRKDKEQILVNNTTDNNEDIVDSAATNTTNTNNNAIVKTTNKKERAYYLKDIPLTPEAFEKSNVKIVAAFYNAGSIYKEELFNNKKSVETFEELIKRYPENKHKLSCYYQLYRTYLVLKNEPKSDYYKNLILTEYPNTEYAKIIKNPDYAKDIAASKSEVEKFYTETFMLYSDGKYYDALANCKRADSLYSKSALMPQFTFLKALCIGRTQDINSFEGALVNVTLKYPKEPVREKAQQILDAIKKQKNPSLKDSTATVAQKYIFSETGDYYWVVIIKNGKGNVNAFKEKLSDINSQTYSIQELSITSMFLDTQQQLVSVKTFNGKKPAMDYYTFMKTNAYLYSDIEAGAYQSFIISSENYTTFYKDKNVEEYQQFFTQNFK